MVAEQNDPGTRAAPAMMDRSRSEAMRQPTLAEEADQAEKEARVTKALQAVDDQGILYHDITSRGASSTPKKTPTTENIPSPVRVDADGNTWTIEDSNASEEEQG